MCGVVNTTSKRFLSIMTTASSFYKLTGQELITRYSVTRSTMELGLSILRKFSFPNQWGKEMKFSMSEEFFNDFSGKKATFWRSVKQLKQIGFLYRTEKGWIINPTGTIKPNEFTFIAKPIQEPLPEKLPIPDIVPQFDIATNEILPEDPSSDELDEIVEEPIHEQTVSGLYPQDHEELICETDELIESAKDERTPGYKIEFGFDFWVSDLNDLKNLIRKDTGRPYAQIANLYLKGAKWYGHDLASLDKQYARHGNIVDMIKRIADYMRDQENVSNWTLHIPEFVREIFLAIQQKRVIMSQDTNEIIQLPSDSTTDIWGLKYGKFEY